MAVGHDLTSAALVRNAIAADLQHTAITPDSADDVILVASELVGNAVVHTSIEDDGLDVSWDVLPDSVVLTVDDGSSTMPHRRTATAAATGGRGLAIVAALAADWGAHRTEHGKQVWARVPVDRRA